MYSALPDLSANASPSDGSAGGANLSQQAKRLRASSGLGSSSAEGAQPQAGKARSKGKQPKADAAGQTNLLRIMIKMLLSLSQQVRDLNSICWEVYILDTDNLIVQACLNAGKRYYTAVLEHKKASKDEHSFGPPPPACVCRHVEAAAEGGEHRP